MKLMKTAALATLIGNIGKQRVAFDTAVQQAAIEVVGQSIVHRNVTPANQLLDVVGAHLKGALVAHLEKFGNIAYSKTEKKIVFFDVEKVTGAALAWTDEYAATVASAVWHKAKKETEPVSSHDVQEEAEKFLDRLAKFAKKGGELKNGELLTALKAAYNRWSAEAYLAQAANGDGIVPVACSSRPVEQERLAALAEKFGGKPEAVAA